MELGANISKFLDGNHFTGHPNTYTKIGQLQESKTNSGSTSVACRTFWFLYSVKVFQWFACALEKNTRA